MQRSSDEGAISQALFYFILESRNAKEIEKVLKEKFQCAEVNGTGEGQN